VTPSLYWCASTHMEVPSIVNEAQLLAHVPPPCLDSRPFGRLRLLDIEVLAARLERLQKHAGVKEAICKHSFTVSSGLPKTFEADKGGW